MCALIDLSMVLQMAIKQFLTKDPINHERFNFRGNSLNFFFFFFLKVSLLWFSDDSCSSYEKKTSTFRCEVPNTNKTANSQRDCSSRKVRRAFGGRGQVEGFHRPISAQHQNAMLKWKCQASSSWSMLRKNARMNLLMSWHDSVSMCKVN
jgi:hypothetical protein